MSRAAREGEGLVVLAAACLWDAARLSDRHLAECLALHRPVLYSEPPISRRRAQLEGRPTGRPSLRKVGESLWVLGPVVLPAKDRVPVAYLTALLDRWSIRRAVGRLGGRADAVISSAVMRDVFGAVDAARRIHWVKDDYVAGAHLIGFSQRRVRRAVDTVAAAADTIVVVSPGLQETFREAGYAPVFIPNGVDAAHFATASADVTAEVALTRPIVGYVGGLNDRIDLDLLAAVADRRVSVLVVGRASRAGDLDRLHSILDRPNVRWVGEKPFEALPAYMSAMDIGIVPYRVDGFNAASFPLKALEYLASGLEVVASDLPALAWLDSDHIHLTGSPTEFADTVERVLDTLYDEDEPEQRRRRCQALASRHAWIERAERFLELIESVAPSEAGR